jgi:hypothetical protein
MIILKVHFDTTCLRKSYPNIRIAWMQFFYLAFLNQSMLTLLLGTYVVICKISILTSSM